MSSLNRKKRLLIFALCGWAIIVAVACKDNNKTTELLKENIIRLDGNLMEVEGDNIANKDVDSIIKIYEDRSYVDSLFANVKNDYLFSRCSTAYQSLVSSNEKHAKYFWLNELLSSLVMSNYIDSNIPALDLWPVSISYRSKNEYLVGDTFYGRICYVIALDSMDGFYMKSEKDEGFYQQLVKDTKYSFLFKTRLNEVGPHKFWGAGDKLLGDTFGQFYMEFNPKVVK